MNPELTPEHIPPLADSKSKRVLCPRIPDYDNSPEDFGPWADFRYLMCDGRLDLGQVCVLTGRFDEAREWFERARVVLDEEGSRSLRAIVDYVEAESIARRGMPAAQGRVDALVASALERFREIGMSGWTRRAQELSG